MATPDRTLPGRPAPAPPSLKTVVIPSAEPATFLGFVLIPGGRRRLPEGNVCRFRNRLRGLRDRWRTRRVARDEVRKRVISWIAHAEHADTWRRRQSILGRGVRSVPGAGPSPCPCMLRGGSWNNKPRNLRSANRNRNSAGNRNNNSGFRIASTLHRRSRRPHGAAGARVWSNLASSQPALAPLCRVRFRGKMAAWSGAGCPSAYRPSVRCGRRTATTSTRPRTSVSSTSRWIRAYGWVCGYTDADLDRVFAPELPGLDREQIRDWYKGYNCLGDETVYNPFDGLLLRRRREFGAYWFETGTPRFLAETLFRRRVGSLAPGQMVGTDDLLSAFDVDHIGTEALLFQTGYLTIESMEKLGGKPAYRLGYPNLEVRQGLNEYLLRYWVHDATRQMANSVRLYRLLEANDLEGMRDLFHAFLASIPYEWYTKNGIVHYEGYYASVFYSYFPALGMDITVEESGSHGRPDMAVWFNGHVYLFEFKVVELSPPGSAMAQLRAKGYADRYRATGQPIHLIAVEFSRQARNLTGFEVAHVRCCRDAEKPPGSCRGAGKPRSARKLQRRK